MCTWQNKGRSNEWRRKDSAPRICVEPGRTRKGSGHAVAHCRCSYGGKSAGALFYTHAKKMGPAMWTTMLQIVPQLIVKSNAPTSES